MFMFKNNYQKSDSLAQIYGMLSLMSCLLFVFFSMYVDENFSFFENWHLNPLLMTIIVFLLASIFFLVLYTKNNSSASKMKELLFENFWTEKATIMIQNFNNYQLDKALNIARTYENKKNEELVKEIENLKEEFSF